ncbi:MAG: hypothetical protein JTT11_03685, partial [Candidatus Brockarchaeota archaeon]|nr:hypothetical protein [Candidatus Brockarchaeota archaeon]
MLVFLIGVLGLWLAPLGAGLVDALHPVIPPYSFHDPQFGWVSMALGISLVVGAMGLSRMAAWGYFMVLLNRFLLGAYCFAYLSLQEQLFLVGYVVPSLLIVAYLVRSRWFFFEAEVPPVQPKKEEVVVPELPRDLAMPSE